MIQEEGQTIYIPGGWIHSVITMRPSISINKTCFVPVQIPRHCFIQKHEVDIRGYTGSFTDFDLIHVATLFSLAKVLSNSETKDSYLLSIIGGLLFEVASMIMSSADTPECVSKCFVSVCKEYREYLTVWRSFCSSIISSQILTDINQNVNHFLTNVCDELRSIDISIQCHKCPKLSRTIEQYAVSVICHSCFFYNLCFECSLGQYSSEIYYCPNCE